MILLIKLSKVIALHVSRALGSAISAINSVCENVAVTMSVCNSLTHVHTHTQMDSAGFLVSTL